MNDLAFEVHHVSPDMAQTWLAANGHNRNIRPARVSTLARDMSAGRWQMTAEPIKFAHDGTLLDGQHRLSAVIKSGVTIPMVVALNVPDESQSVMDSGSRRSAGDALRLAGEKHTSLTAAAVRLALAYERGFFDGAGGSARSTSTPDVTHAPTPR